MTTRRLAWATIFSRSSAPPPPLITFSWGSTSSAPSMVRSISRGISWASRGIPRRWASSQVARDVAKPRMSQSAPWRSSSARWRVAKIAVEPVPRPTTMPDSMSVTACSAACFLYSSCCGASDVCRSGTQHIYYSRKAAGNWQDLLLRRICRFLLCTFFRIHHYGSAAGGLPGVDPDHAHATIRIGRLNGFSLLLHPIQTGTRDVQHALSGTQASIGRSLAALVHALSCDLLAIGAGAGYGCLLAVEAHLAIRVGSHPIHAGGIFLHLLTLFAFRSGLCTHRFFGQRHLPVSVQPGDIFPLGFCISHLLDGALPDFIHLPVAIAIPQ